jgi:DNA repair exonuclease SbcCD ATPase subunit
LWSRTKTNVIQNYQCYAGVHELSFAPKAYAIVAQHKDDEERSNWLGKTTFLEAVVFALFGVHRWRYDDQWVTKGRASGLVRLVLSNGMTIQRSRTTGTPTKLEVEFGAHRLVGNEAQTMIEKTIGLDSEAFVTTSFLAQKKHARLVSMSPAERAKVVSVWARLERLETWRAKVVSDLSEVNFRKQYLTPMAMESTKLINLLGEQIIQETRKLTCDYPHGANASQMVDALQAFVDAQQQQLESLQIQIEISHRDRERTFELLETDRLFRRYQEVETKLREKRALLETLQEHPNTTAQERERISTTARELTYELTIKQHELRELKELKSCGFDGICPVMQRECFAKADVMSSIGSNVNERIRALATTIAPLEEKRLLVQQLDSDWNRAREEVELLRRSIRELEQEHEELPIPPEGYTPIVQEAGQSYGVLKARLDEIQDELREPLDLLSQYRKAQSTQRETMTRLSSLSQRQAMLETASLIFGKDGAQRSLGMQVTQTLSDIANAVLQSAQIDLEVDLKWDRQTQRLADACTTCAAPLSGKQTRCHKCDAIRQPKMIQQLHVDLSNQSGAAEDMAGIALQIAAAHWMRVQCDSQWSVALLDEPFGALDATHRRALSQHVTNLFGGQFGFAQSFVIAHHASVLDALPGRISIVSDGKHSQIEAR